MADIPAISGSDAGTWKSSLNTIIGLINGKFNSRPYQWANAAARTAQTGMTIGEYGYQADTQITYRAISATTTQAWNSPWITYTATLANITLGATGTSVFQYKYQLGSVLVRGRIKIAGAGAAMGTGPTFTLPVSSRALVHAYETFFGGSRLFDDSAGVAGTYPATIVANNTSVSVALIQYQSGTISGTLSSTNPFTWAASDALDIDCLFEPA